MNFGLLKDNRVVCNCKDGGCYRFFTCNSWPNSRLYAVAPTKNWQLRKRHSTKIKQLE